MAFTNLSVKDASAATKTLRTVTISSDQVSAHVSHATAEQTGAGCYYNLDVQNAGVAPIKGTSPPAAGQVYGGVVTNCSAAIRYLKFYNKATAATFGDGPVFVIAINANQSVQIPNLSCGIAFSAGIAIRATTGRADNDNGAPTAGDVVVTVLYA